ncbi:MAG TPA: hypothetical protein VGJ33_19745 [Candidatus Angelobacter sp.]|jgi:uncharacterized membrane protein
MPLRGKALLNILVFCSVLGLNLNLSGQDGSSTGKCGFQNLIIHSPAGTSGNPTALNDKGSVVGLLNIGIGTANVRTIGFLQQSSGEFTSFNFPGAHDTFARDINKNGLIVGSWDTQPGQIVSEQHAFKVQNGVFKEVTIPGFPGSAALAEGVNDLGDIVGQFNDHGSNVGFLLHNGKLTIISFPGAKQGTLPLSINNSGVVVGTYMLFPDDIPHGFIWKNGNFTNLTTPAGFIATPNKISNGGDIVGSFVDANLIEHGFSLDKGRFTSIDFPGSIDTRILAVNSFDNVVGLASVKSGSGFSNIDFKGFCSSVF